MDDHARRQARRALSREKKKHHFHCLEGGHIGRTPQGVLLWQAATRKHPSLQQLRRAASSTVLRLHSRVFTMRTSILDAKRMLTVYVFVIQVSTSHSCHTDLPTFSSTASAATSSGHTLSKQYTWSNGSPTTDGRRSAPHPLPGRQRHPLDHSQTCRARILCCFRRRRRRERSHAIRDRGKHAILDKRR